MPPPEHLQAESSLCPPGAAAGPRESRAAAGGNSGPPGSSALCDILKKKKVEMKTFQLCRFPPPPKSYKRVRCDFNPSPALLRGYGVTRAGGAKSGAALPPPPFCFLSSTLLVPAFQHRKPSVLWEEIRLL